MYIEIDEQITRLIDKGTIKSPILICSGYEAYVREEARDTCLRIVEDRLETTSEQLSEIVSLSIERVFEGDIINEEKIEEIVNNVFDEILSREED